MIENEYELYVRDLYMANKTEIDSKTFTINFHNVYPGIIGGFN